MFAILQLLRTLVANLFRPRRRLQVEILFLQLQLNTGHCWRGWLGGPTCSVCPLLFGLTRSCGGIEQGFDPIGAGNLVDGQGGIGSALSCVNSSAE